MEGRLKAILENPNIVYFHHLFQDIQLIWNWNDIHNKKNKYERKEK